MTYKHKSPRQHTPRLRSALPQSATSFPSLLPILANTDSSLNTNGITGFSYCNFSFVVCDQIYLTAIPQTVTTNLLQQAKSHRDGDREHATPVSSHHQQLSRTGWQRPFFRVIHREGTVLIPHIYNFYKQDGKKSNYQKMGRLVVTRGGGRSG